MGGRPQGLTADLGRRAFLSGAAALAASPLLGTTALLGATPLPERKPRPAGVTLCPVPDREVRDSLKRQAAGHGVEQAIQYLVELLVVR